MVWVKIDDGFPEHRKALAAGDDACWLFVTALCYSARNLTDGYIPSAQVGRLTGQRTTEKLTASLVDAGLFDVVDGGFQIHDYSDYQPTKEAVSKRREGTAERVRKHRSNGVTDIEVTTTPLTGAGARPSGSGSGPGAQDVQGAENMARGQAAGVLHPHLAEVVSILEQARGPQGGLDVEPASIDSMLRAHPDGDGVSAAHEVASIVAQGTNRTPLAGSILGSVLRRQKPGTNVRELPQRPTLSNSRDPRRFDAL